MKVHKYNGRKNYSPRTSVADLDPETDPEGSKTFGRIQFQSGSEINILDPDSNTVLNPDLKPDPKQICKKEPYIEAKIRHNLKFI